MPRYKLTVAYDGTHFHGWQRQEPPAPAEPLRTVQGVLTEAIVRTVREPVQVVGASRTDAGVHARAQVAAFSTTIEIPITRLPAAINSHLPDDVQVRSAEVVADTFDPISDCVAKGYRYSLAHGGPPLAPDTTEDALRPLPHRPPLFSRHHTTYVAHRLDPVRMNLAARRLVGEHDFASFAQINHGRDSTIRTIYDCQVNVTSAHRVRIDVCGNGFLYNMIRIIAGTLLEVGRGKLDINAVSDILAARDRRAAGPTLGPQGLCLMWVRYRSAVG